jgi:hypothetical protein
MFFKSNRKLFTVSQVKEQDLLSDEGFLNASKMERWFLVSLFGGRDK